MNVAQKALGNNQSGTGARDDTAIKDVLEELRPIEKFTGRSFVVLTVLIVFFSINIAAKTGETSWKAVSEFLLAAAVSFVVAIAAAAVGCVLGFLFGIPRSLQRGREGDAVKTIDAGDEAKSTVQRTFVTNTSLEEISDWLTKIIIGLGLVQFQTLINYLYTAALYAASLVAHSNIVTDGQASKPTYDSTIASPFYFALIVVCLLSACFFAYVETRTRLSRLFLRTVLEQKREETLATKEEIDRALTAPTEKIDELQKAVNRILPQNERLASMDPGTGSAEPLTPEKTEAAKKRMRQDLESKQFTWRTIATLARNAGLSPRDAKSILEVDPDVQIGKDRQGNDLAKLRSR
jgi:hypothetical protein